MNFLGRKQFAILDIFDRAKILWEKLYCVVICLSSVLEMLGVALVDIFFLRFSSLGIFSKFLRYFCRDVEKERNGRLGNMKNSILQFIEPLEEFLPCLRGRNF